MYQIENKGLEEAFESILNEGYSEKIAALQRQVSDDKKYHIPIMMRHLIDAFKQKKILKNPIEMTADEFFSQYNSYQKSYELGKKEFAPPADSPVVFENDSAIVWAVQSHEFVMALKEYGVTWCTASQEPDYLARYTKENNFFVLQNKADKSEIYNLAIDKATGDFVVGDNKSVDAKNKNIDPKQILRKFKVPEKSITGFDYKTPAILSPQEDFSNVDEPGHLFNIVKERLSSGKPIDSITVAAVEKMSRTRRMYDINKTAEYIINSKKTAYASLLGKMQKSLFSMAPEVRERVVDFLVKTGQAKKELIESMALVGALPTRFITNKEFHTFLTAFDYMGYNRPNETCPFATDEHGALILAIGDKVQATKQVFNKCVMHLYKDSGVWRKIINRNPGLKTIVDEDSESESIADVIENSENSNSTWNDMSPEEQEAWKVKSMAALKADPELLDDNKNNLLLYATPEFKDFVEEVLGKEEVAYYMRNMIRSSFMSEVAPRWNYTFTTPEIKAYANEWMDDNGRLDSPTSGARVLDEFEKLMKFITKENMLRLANSSDTVHTRQNTSYEVTASNRLIRLGKFIYEYKDKVKKGSLAEQAVQKYEAYRATPKKN